MSFQKQFLKAFMKKKFISIHTEQPDNDSYDGIIVALTQSYIIIAQELDYEFDGYVLIPRCNICGYRQSDVEQFSYNLMKSSGDITQLEIPNWMQQSKTNENAFSAIMSHNPWMRISWVCPNCDDIHVDVGKLIAYDDESISMDLYHKNGSYQGEMGWAMNKIYALEFDAKFLVKFANYFKNK